MYQNGKLAALVKAVLWGLLVLLFPLASGVLSGATGLGTEDTLLMQGIFMVASLMLPISLVLHHKWKWSEIGFGKLDRNGCKKALYFIPVIALYIPVAIYGFYFESSSYVFGSIFLYLFVGIAEEIYYRGIVPNYLGRAFSEKSCIVLSIVIFGVGHMATAFAGNGFAETMLTVVNAFIFGWMAIEITMLSRSIAITIVIHFLFDFETKIVVMSGTALMVAEGVRGAIMFILALWLTAIRKKTNFKINR